MTLRILSCSSSLKSIFNIISISSFTILFNCGCVSSSILKEPGVSENTQYVRIYNLNQIDSVTIDGVSVHDEPHRTFTLLISVGYHQILGECNYITTTIVDTYNTPDNKYTRQYETRHHKPIIINYDFKEGTSYQLVLRDANDNIDPHIETADRFWYEYCRPFGIIAICGVGLYYLCLQIF